MAPTEKRFPAAPVLGGGANGAAAFQYYLSADENLRVEVRSRVSPVVIDVAWRFWRAASGEVQIARDFVTADGSSFVLPNVRIFKLEAGALVGVRISTRSATPFYGQVWVRAQIVRGFEAATEIVATLIQGYISLDNEVAWPGSPLEKLHDGRGVIGAMGWTYLVAPPRASFVVPAGVRWRPVCGAVVFTTSAVPGNRIVTLQVRSVGGLTYWFAAAAVPQPASVAQFYSYAPDVDADHGVISALVQIRSPADIELQVGDVLEYSAISWQFGDFFTDGATLLREWIDG